MKKMAAEKKTQKKEKTTTKKGFRFDLNRMLLMFALIPLFIGGLATTIYTTETAQKEVKTVMHNYMYTMAEQEGSLINNFYGEKGMDALSKLNLTSYCADVKLEGIPSSYAYVADKNGTMLWHPTEDKIGQPVTNETILEVCSKMSAGKSIKPDVVEYVFKGAKKYAAYWVNPDNTFVVVISADEDEVMGGISAMRSATVVIDLIIFAIFIGVALFFARVVAKPLIAVANAITKTAEGDLNANTKIHSIVVETKQIISAAATLQTVLQDTIGTTQEISMDLKDGADKVSSLSERSKEGADQIAAAIEEIAQGATSMAENVQEINADVIEISYAIEDITGSTNELNNSSNKIKDANAEAVTYMNKVADSSVQSVRAVNEISAQVSETNDAVGRIQEAVEMISTIADQTNLLALNASIEAARAGEAGRGFAVVATEIKNLSEQSNNSADEIKRLVTEIVNQSETSVKLTGEVAEIINKEQVFIEDTQTKFNLLNQEIETSLTQIDAIGGKVDALNASKDRILSAVSDLSAISEENAASSEEVSASVSEITDSITEIAENSAETNQKAEDLANTIKYFQ